MKYTWQDYNPKTMDFVENWLDEYAVEKTGIDDGWEDFYEYWSNDKNTVPGENLWCKVVFENNKPFAVVAVGFHDENTFTIMEIVIDPTCRRQGKGSELLKELLANGEFILGKEVQIAEAVIYPSNLASQKAFEKSGFRFRNAQEDGGAWDYVYEKELVFGISNISCLENIKQTHEIRSVGIDERKVFNKHLKLCKPKSKRLFFKGVSQSDWEKWNKDGTEYYLLFVDGKPVSRCAIEKYSNDKWEAADVRTAPEYINKGYSKEVVAYVTRKILEQGKTATCRTLAGNSAMLKVIDTLGYKRK